MNRHLIDSDPLPKLGDVWFSPQRVMDTTFVPIYNRISNDVVSIYGKLQTCIDHTQDGKYINPEFLGQRDSERRAFAKRMDALESYE